MLSLLVSFSALHAQTESLLKPARIIFYNVENLFDTINSPDTQDEDFLPDSKNKWNSKKYQVKLNHVARVLSSMLDTIQPLAIGLSEIENRQVLEDLIVQPAMKKFNLGIIHHDSPDERGIDCALLYNKDFIEEVFDATLPVNFIYQTKDKTRDILYFKGFMSEDYSIYFFINHWPSRRGEKEESERKRMFAAKTLKAKLENLYLGEPYARVVAMGDFNDNPSDTSLHFITAREKSSKAPQMVNLMKPLEEKGEFSLRYQDQHDVFDQLIVSDNLVNTKNRYFIRQGEAHIYSPAWLLFNHPKYGMIPNRTYANGKWIAGYSDHLPVYMDVVFK